VISGSLPGGACSLPGGACSLPAGVSSLPGGARGLAEALEAYRNKPIVKKYHHLVAGKSQHVDSHKNSKMTWRLYSSIKENTRPTAIMSTKLQNCTVCVSLTVPYASVWQSVELY